MGRNLGRAGGLGFAVVTAMMLAACGSSPSSPPTTITAPPTTATAPPTTTTTAAGSETTASASPSVTAAPADSFCADLGDYSRQFKSAVGDGQLTSLKGSLAAVVDKGNKVLAQAPSTIDDDLAGLTSDLSQFNDFVQNKATQQDIDSSTPPPELTQPLADLSIRGGAVKDWYKKNCNGDFGS